MKTKTRVVNGVLLLDKPLNMTANTALQTVKRLYQASKAGHTGSLDPLATGMLPICFGEATKFSQYLLNADKHYFVVAELGIKTTTGDAEGQVVEKRPVADITEQQLQNVLEKFRGTVTQIPSMFSALKHNGRPLYELARQGITVDRPAREIQVYELNLVAREDNYLTLSVHCSKGTYIRTLVEDIGEALGCGAYVKVLRRPSAGDYQEKQMVSLSTLQAVPDDANKMQQLDSYLLPIETMFTNLDLVTVSPAASYYLVRGQPVIVPQAPTAGFVRLVVRDGKFLGVGEILDDGRVAPRRLVVTQNL